MGEKAQFLEMSSKTINNEKMISIRTGVKIFFGIDKKVLKKIKGASKLLLSGVVKIVKTTLLKIKKLKKSK